MTSAAAVLVAVVAIGVAVFANLAQTASAEEVLQKLQVEASTTAPGPGTCGLPAGAPPPGGGVIAFNAGSEPGPVTTVSTGDPAQISDKLAQALGVSGDRVRQAMRETLSASLPSGPPPDPIAGIAKQLGVSNEQVCAAFANGSNGGVGLVGSMSKTDHNTVQSQVFIINGTAINLDSESADQLQAPAQKLGVTPERLLAAIKAAVPPPPPLPATPPKPDDLINRLAQNLGVSPDKVRAAITQVEGPNRFFFVVPLQGQ